MGTMEVDDAGGLPQAISALKESVSISASIREEELDELRYSRVIHTLGRDAFEALRKSRVLVLGCRAVGAEVSKNLTLSGVRGIGLVDDGLVAPTDIGKNFLLREQDIGRKRSLATAFWLKHMNSDVTVVALEGLGMDGYASVIASYQAVVATSGTVPYFLHVDNVCRAARVPFILALSRGVFLSIFTDFGPSFTIVDHTGEPSEPVLVESITQDFPATVMVVDEQRHGLEEGDEIVFDGIQGMSELNNRVNPFTVSVTGTSSFTIPEDTRTFGRYISGGWFRKLRRGKSLGFASLEKSMLYPQFCISDPAKASRAAHLHVAFQAIDEYERSSEGSVVAIKEKDADEVVALARQIWRQGRTEKVSHNGNTAMDVVGEGLGLGSGRCDLDGSLDHPDPASRSYLKDKFSKSEQWSDVPSGDFGRIQRAAETSTSGGSHIGDALELGKDRLSNPNRGELDEILVRLVAHGAHAELPPVAAITGGLATQEVIKALSGVFMPIHQWLYFDAVECLPTQRVRPEEKIALDLRYNHQVSLFGMDFQQKLGSLKWLVIGAGGIGCEVLKNLVLMGVGCNPDGSITITDMDSVSKPNLPYQVLYQMGDVGRPKSPTAARALRSINPTAQIHALQERFDSDTENIFDSSFFQSISGVISAVDSSESRIYIDARCVSNRKPMIDGGKHGAKGSVQVFVPFQSEMYASTRDPPEHREVPICTLKNFPYATEHTLRWSIETFEALFKQRPVDVNSYLSNRDFQNSIKKSPPNARLPIMQTLRDALVRHRPLSFESCIEWARFKFEELFFSSIKQLCFNFPPDMTTTAGAPFWSGTKRAPSPIEFNASDPLHMDFIVAAANLQATVYGLKGYEDRQLFVDALQRVVVPAFVPKEGVRIATTDSELRNMNQRTVEDTEASDSCESILQELPTPASLAGYRLTPIEFDKDAERSFHVEFVAAASNLRAKNYGIPSTDKLQARLVGGKVIPAIVTCASVVGGLMCLELYKLLQQKPLSEYKHGYFNLSLPFFAFAQPLKAVEMKVARREGSPLVWTLWDRFEMDCVGKTLETFLADFKRQQGLEIIMISYGKSLLYAEFLPKKKLQDRLPLTLLDLITVVAKVSVPVTETMVSFGLSCTDADKEDVEVPDLIAKIR